MLTTQGDTKLSITGIEFSGSSPFRKQQRGSDSVTIKYSIVTKVLNEATKDIEEVAMSHHEATLNGQFKDDEFKEAIIHFKTLAVKFLQEASNDTKVVIDDAIDKINAGK